MASSEGNANENLLRVVKEAGYEADENDMEEIYDVLDYDWTPPLLPEDYHIVWRLHF